MEIDVLYRVPKDLCWQYINRFVKEESVNLALYRSCPDIYTTKKTIWNAAGRITPGGIFCIQAHPENVSDVIRLVQQKGYKYKVIYFDFTWASDNSVFTYVLAYKTEFSKPNIDTLLRIDSIDELGNKLIGLSDFGDLVLCIGDATMPFVERAKRLGRNIIAFGDDEIWTQSAQLQGVREVVL